jgi:hypothetical protein
MMDPRCKFLTISVGNLKFRCLVLDNGGFRPETDDEDNDAIHRWSSLQPKSSVSMFDVSINAGAGSNPTQPNSQSDFESAVDGALSNDSNGLIRDTKDRATGQGVTDCQQSTSATVSNGNVC